ncbi:hypothetical protein ACFL4G_12080 [Thermodesulfobacteriota bacterium]
MEASKIFQGKSATERCCGDNASAPATGGREEIIRPGSGHFARKRTELIATLALVIAVLSLLFMMVTARGVNTPLATVQGQIVQMLDSVARLDASMNTLDRSLSGQREGQLLSDLAQAEALLDRASTNAGEDERARLEALKKGLSSIRMGLLPIPGAAEEAPGTAVTETAE